MYPYEKLTSEGSAIRLLTLHQGGWTSPIRCNLYHTSLEEAPSFEALSYMWGDATNKVEISVNDYRFQVTKNLHQALRYLRREAEPRTFWIDALCINQDDLLERSQQVRLMSKIYSTALGVSAWVGESDEDSNAAFDLIADMEVLMPGAPETKEERDTNINAITKPSQPKVVSAISYEPVRLGSQEGNRAQSGNDEEHILWGQMMDKSSISMVHTKLELDTDWYLEEELMTTLAALDSLAKPQFTSSQLLGAVQKHSKWLSPLELLSRPYFRRVWIIQELHSAGILRAGHSKCSVICGWGSAPLLSIYKLWKSLQLIETNFGSYELYGHAWIFGDVTGVDEPLRSLVEYGPLHGQSKTPGILNVLEKPSESLAKLITSTTSFEATDPRDKIYALLNVATKWVDMPEFNVDYSQPVSQVLKDVVLYEIQGGGSLEILEGNRFCTDGCRPSWIPDPSILSPTGYEWQVSPRFSASGNLKSCPSLDSSSNILHLQGIRLASVATKFGPFMFGPQFREDHLTELRQFYESADKRKQELLWQTLVLDTDRTNFFQRNCNRPAPAEFGLMCDVFFGLSNPPRDYCPTLDKESRKKRYPSVFLTNMFDSARRRCVFETQDGRIGLGPEDVRPGDIPAVLFGGKTCFMLRAVGPHFQLIGDCYIQDAMDGELITKDQSGSIRNASEIALC